MLTEQQAAAVGFFFPADDAQQQLQGPAPHAIVSGAPSRQIEHSQGHATPPSSLKVPKVPKLQCSVQRCKRVAAEECRLCKTCCGSRGHGCTNRKHGTNPPQTIHATTFSPTRPYAIAPLPHIVLNAQGPPMIASGSTLTPDLEVTPRRFCTDMPSEWAKEWNEREQEVIKRQEAAELKKKNELAIARKVVIQLWRQVCTR